MKLFIIGLVFSILNANNYNTIVEISTINKTEPLELVLYERYYLGNEGNNNAKIRIIKGKVENGKTTFKFNLDDMFHYFYIRSEKNINSPLTPRAIIERKDKIYINQLNDGFIANGKGYEKVNFSYNLLNEYNKIYDSLLKEMKVPDFKNITLKQMYMRFQNNTESGNYLINQLNNNKNISNKLKSIMAFEILSLQFNMLIGYQSALSSKKLTESEKAELIEYYKKFRNLALIDVDDQDADLSYYWLHVNLIKVKNDVLSALYPDIFNAAINNFSNFQSQKLIAANTIKRYSYSSNPDSILQTTLKQLNNPFLKEELLYHYNNLSIGKPAFNFNLKDKNGTFISLRSFKGKVVFIDFWYVGCAPCIRYFEKTVKPVEMLFKDNSEVVFITIGLVKDYEQWKEALNTNLYTSPYSINLYSGDLAWNSEVAKEYSVTATPKPILIDRSGNIFSNDMYLLGTNNPKNLIESIEQCLKIKN